MTTRTAIATARIAAAALLLGAACRCRAATQAGATASNRTLRAYHIGNSLTFGVFPNDQTDKLFASRGGAYVRGMHILWGSPLSRIWDNPSSNNVTLAPFGTFSHALTQFDWDVLTLQPYASGITGDKGDLAECRNFIKLATRRSPGVQVYIYATWPPRPGTNAPDAFARTWDAQYTGQRTGGVPCRDYCQNLVQMLRRELPAVQNPVLLIPAGDVLYELDGMMRAGRVPGFTSVRDLYKDGIHLNAAGNYAVKCTFYAVLFRQSPVGLPNAAQCEKVSDTVARIIQETVWNVVCANELTGCAPAEDAGTAAK